MKHHDIFPYIEIMSPSVKDQSVGVQQQVEAKPETGNKLQHTLLHDTIQVQRHWHANILYIGTLCGRIVPLYLLSHFGTIDHAWHNCQAANLHKWTLIHFQLAAITRNCGEQTRLARAASTRAWHLL